MSSHGHSRERAHGSRARIVLAGLSGSITAVAVLLAAAAVLACTGGGGGHGSRHGGGSYGGSQRGGGSYSKGEHGSYDHGRSNASYNKGEHSSYDQGRSNASYDKSKGEGHGANGKGGGGNSANAHEHVTICHATPPDTAANGYVRISPSASGVYHGHYREHAADIIPPFTYNGQTYSLNWDSTGQAIWNNGCVVPDSATTTTTTSTSSGSGSSSSSGSSSTGGVASATATKSGVKAVTHRAHPARAKTGAASFTG